MPDRAKVYHREKTFYDNTSLENEGNFPYKGGATRAAEQTFFTFLGDLKGKTVLEYGCGTGKQLITLARAGAHAIGIELSPTRAKQANQSVKNLTLNNASVVLMNAEQLGFADESFDLICGGAILHHLELSTTMREIKRVLAPNGFAVFLEPLGKNPLIRLYRKKTPALRTPDERPLVDADIETINRHFHIVERKHFFLIALFSYTFRTVIKNEQLFRLTLRITQAIDRLLLEIFPFLRNYTWIVVMKLQARNATKCTKSQLR